MILNRYSILNTEQIQVQFMCSGPPGGQPFVVMNLEYLLTKRAYELYVQCTVYCTVAHSTYSAQYLEAATTCLASHLSEYALLFTGLQKAA